MSSRPHLKSNAHSRGVWSFVWLTVCGETGRFLDIIPPLSLMRSRFPSLTRGKDGTMCVNLGPPGCSTGVTSLYSPLSGKTTAESPDVLAKVLSDSGISQIVDDRPPTEILVIALDRSGSMNSNFEDLDALPPAPVARDIPITAHDAQVALLRLRNSSWGPVFQQQLYKTDDYSYDQFAVLGIVAQLHHPVRKIDFSSSSSSFPYPLFCLSPLGPPLFLFLSLSLSSATAD